VSFEASNHLSLEKAREDVIFLEQRLCGGQKKESFLKNCRNYNAKDGLKKSCQPIVFDCVAPWPRNRPLNRSSLSPGFTGFFPVADNVTSECPREGCLISVRDASEKRVATSALYGGNADGRKEECILGGGLSRLMAGSEPRQLNLMRSDRAGV
jgi:hypothetical protein